MTAADKPAIGSSAAAPTFYENFQAVQHALKAPKDQEGRFGRHRSAEAILAAVKRHLNEHQLILTLSDEVRLIGDRNYVKATATVTNGTESISATAWAWEGEVSRGLDASQVTGVSSSYARKYALQGLFAIDDTTDADSKTFEPGDPMATKEQKKEIANLLVTLDVKTPNEMLRYVREKYSLDMTDLTVTEAEALLKALRSDAALSMEPTA